MNKCDWLRAIAAGLAIIGCLFSAWFILDGRYAKASDLKMTDLRFDYKIEGDQYKSMQQRLFQLENQYSTSDPNKVNNPRDKQQMQELKMQLPLQQERLLWMEKQMKGFR